MDIYDRYFYNYIIYIYIIYHISIIDIISIIYIYIIEHDWLVVSHVFIFKRIWDDRN